ncbi:oxidoreductase [Fulvimonas soli]|jgi:NAD(P)-dependent dehydrogenase (short-subunit alcohol dehydrogenase family)|uniref:Short-subunit dehydrogenase n=1 Tax=Fulvimonas soli TaxID=155197 RepID=A0A316IG16_9GAMM|nr:oxidoreductase [Fulvimonas soli]PWK92281.1 short-subunit dehydrogenase [Fulvimonas soli]TNY25632.1 short-chain dehydrogenase/reductase [Fulvimonas soli]
MNKIALVTGASSGIGEATVRRLAADGWRVYAAARRVERMQTLAALGARVLALDLCDDASMVAAVETVRSECGRLDALVNNAGYGSYGALEDVPLEEARRQFEVNVFGLARLTQLALPTMRAQGGGTIVNVTSIGGKMHEPLGSWYHATKFAVEGLSDCLRMELAPFGIRVVVVEPGAIRTEWSGIARDSLLARSGHTAYAAQAEAHARMLSGGDTSALASPPEVVAATIARALRARRPRTRYATGGGARTILLLRRLLSDRGFDALMRFAESRLAG